MQIEPHEHAWRAPRRRSAALLAGCVAVASTLLAPGPAMATPEDNTFMHVETVGSAYDSISFIGFDESRLVEGTVVLLLTADGSWTMQGSLVNNGLITRTARWQCHVISGEDPVTGEPLYFTVRTPKTKIEGLKLHRFSVSGSRSDLQDNDVLEAIASTGYADCDIVVG